MVFHLGIVVITIFMDNFNSLSEAFDCGVVVDY
jgi:hypothetical protein